MSKNHYWERKIYEEKHFKKKLLFSFNWDLTPKTFPKKKVLTIREKKIVFPYLDL
ncbi:hypothetical protein C1645_754811 [Glomus cerebriforme]|uniref:Uncharacterized protein n=1 Tax=Glomus cerebriforme TaxID=658196 RepID=A0A397TN74_9GLOM|nr:hypothetical protein C1645_754811 [Glomus cerebriforme]